MNQSEEIECLRVHLKTMKKALEKITRTILADDMRHIAAEALRADRDPYALYSAIAREVYGRVPITREQWDAIPKRSYFRSALAHDDGTFDTRKEAEGDAQ